MLKKINSLFVTMFGIGKLPRIPGSYASLVTVIFLYILFHIFSVPADDFLFLLVGIFIISLFAVNLFIKDLTNKDPKEVVIDEFIGQSIPLLICGKDIVLILLSCLIFRIFDIFQKKGFQFLYYFYCCNCRS